MLESQAREPGDIALPQCGGNREHTHTQSPRQESLLCHLILREGICLLDPRFSH